MIVLRNKNFSIWSETLDWAKKFTPRIPLGNNSRLFIVGPWTLVGAGVGAIIGAVKGVKHFILGSPEKNTHDKEHNENPSEKRFSNIPMKSDFKEYCKAIPGYEKLAILSSLNFKMLSSLPEEGKKLVWKYFPSFLTLASPEQINFYRKDYLESDDKPGDYSEVLFTYGNELVYLWDFDRKSWYVQDRTYKPLKEWKINGDIIDAIKVSFNPAKNNLLAQRMIRWEKEGMQERTGFNIKEYVNCLLEIIDSIEKIYKSR